MTPNSKIFVAGARGLVGSALVRVLREAGFTNVLSHTRETANLESAAEVKWYFSSYQPEVVFLAAARVGGIEDNIRHPVEFFCRNIAIQQNVIMSAAEYGVKKLVFLGSSCIYPKDSPQPIPEESLLTGPLEPSNEAYALAKISGVKLCQWLREERGCDFVSAMPCNVFGPGDNFKGDDAHIIPGLISRMHRAKVAGDASFDVWGNGTARREFIYSEDLARALLCVAQGYSSKVPINTGSGFELSVAELAPTIASVVGYPGELVFNQTKPTGVMRKLLDNTKLFSLGWRPQTDFKSALEITYESFLHSSRL